VDIPERKVVIPLTNNSLIRTMLPSYRRKNLGRKNSTSGDPAFFWMADRWQSTPDGIKAMIFSSGAHR